MSSGSTKLLLEKKQATNRILREIRQGTCVTEKQRTNAILKNRKDDHDRSSARFDRHLKLISEISDDSD